MKSSVRESWSGMKFKKSKKVTKKMDKFKTFSFVHVEIMNKKVLRPKTLKGYRIFQIFINFLCKE